MADGLPDPPALDPADLAGRSFGRTRKGKGFEPAEVRTALGAAADALRVWQERDERLRSQVRDLQDTLASADEISDDRLVALMGEETVQVIRTARSAADEIRREADEAAAAARAELELARSETEQLRREALHAAEAELESARQRGRAMVAEAREVRERMLRDLAERRQLARQQIEAARAGRDRIVEALRSAGGAVEGLAGLLGELDDEIQQVSDRAAAEVSDDIGEVVAAVRAELDRAGVTEPVVAATSAGAEPVGTAGSASVAAAEGAEGAAGEVEVVYDDVVVEFAPPASRATAERSDDTSDDEGADLLGPDDLDDGDEWFEDDDLYDDEDLYDDDLDEEDDDGEPPVAPVVTGPVGVVLVPDCPTNELSVARRTVGADAEVIDFPGALRGRPDDHDDVPDDVPGVAVDEVEAERSDGTAAPDGPAGAAPDGTGNADLVADIFERMRSGGSADASGDAAPAAPAADPVPAAPVPTDPEPTGPAVALDERLLDDRDAAVAPHLRSLGRTLKRLVTDEQNDLLDQLRRSRRKDLPTLEDLLGEATDDLGRYRDALAGDLGAIAATGAALWSGAGGAVEGTVPDPGRAVAAVEPVLDGALRQRRARLAAALDAAAADAVEVAELGDRLRSAYRDWRTGSLDELVGDLVTAALAAGVRGSAPSGAPCRWVADHGGLPCADAEDNVLAGRTSLGEQFPTGDVVPPAHPGCRCLLVPADVVVTADGAGDRPA